MKLRARLGDSPPSRRTRSSMRLAGEHERAGDYRRQETRDRRQEGGSSHRHSSFSFAQMRQEGRGRVGENQELRGMSRVKVQELRGKVIC